MEQTYPGVEDYEAHFYEMLSAFKDKRYMRMEDGRLIFGIFNSDSIPNVDTFFEVWNKLAKENGLEGFYFFGLVQGADRYEKAKASGYDTIVYDCLHDYRNKPSTSIISRIWYKLNKRSLIHITQYSDYASGAMSTYRRHPDYTPCINPDFDHSPRSGMSGIIFHKSTPSKWGELLKVATETVCSKANSNNLLFIKAWNEWGEGNYLEPDSKWGKEYIEETAKALSQKNV